MLYLAKVGVVGSNPIARSNFFKHLAEISSRTRILLPGNFRGIRS